MTTRVALLTPVGRSAIACIAVQGPDALSVVATSFQPRTPLDWHRLPSGRILVGIWQSPTEHSTDGSSVGEEVILCRMGLERIEVHCHGGQAAVQRILTDLERAGCVRVDCWTSEQATWRTRVQADAVLALAQASTERTSRILLDQYQGAFDHRLAAIDAALASNDVATARRQVHELLRWAQLGLHLTCPWRIVLAGPPNVGKSSLINALVGYQRTIVDEAPGTTRDVVGVSTAFGGWPVELSDTAGVRSTDDPLEAQGVKRTLEHLTGADLVLLVTDPVAESNAAQAEFARRLELVASLRVLNKCDLLPSPTEPACADQQLNLHTSALTGEGLPQLISAIVARLVPEDPPAGTSIPFNSPQLELLNQLSALLDQGAVRESRDQLLRWERR